MVAKAMKAIESAWPPAAIALAVALNGVWIAVIGYWIYRFF
jgi:CBS-domain-containing membrane protein